MGPREIFQRILGKLPLDIPSRRDVTPEFAAEIAEKVTWTVVHVVYSTHILQL
jgi:hypothetical protein